MDLITVSCFACYFRLFFFLDTSLLDVSLFLFLAGVLSSGASLFLFLNNIMNRQALFPTDNRRMNIRYRGREGVGDNISLSYVVTYGDRQFPKI